MKGIFTLILCALAIVATAQKPKHYYIEMNTGKGQMIIQLYNETPKHRDNFKKLVEEQFYDSLLFHRVIKNFMIQGGDPNSKHAITNAALGDGGPDYKVVSEIQGDLIHKKGALGAAREGDNVNPAKKSSASQFYIVQGRKFTQAGLDSIETFRLKGKKLSPKQREVYSTIGGTPHLDGNYTVFGEVLSGIDAVDKIAEVRTNPKDRPVVDEHMYLRLLTRREAINMDRLLEGLKPKNGFFQTLFDGFKSKKYKL